MAPYVKELWVYPVKSCRGTRVKEAEMVASGFSLDREWCVVDVEGRRYPAREYLSQRKIPCMATVSVEVEGRHLLINAPGMQELKVPVDAQSYEGEERVTVKCGGVSTTDPNATGWQLGVMEGASAGTAAEAWFTEYLNSADAPEKKRLPTARYLLVRMLRPRRMADWAGPGATMGQTIPGAEMRGFDGVRDGDRVSFQDFAPFLVVSDASNRWVSGRMGVEEYPTASYRASIVVSGCPPWDEESWETFDIGPYRFRRVKECPRCSVPCRDQQTGGYVFSPSFQGATGSKLQVTLTLKKAFPDKARDPEWGTWKGPVMGVYVGHGGQEGVLREGMRIDVVSRRGSGRWACLAASSLAAAAAAVGIMYWRKQCQ